MKRLAICLGLALAACAPAPQSPPPPEESAPVTAILRECAPPDCNGVTAVRNVEFGAAALGARMDDKPRGWRRDRLSCDSAMLYGSRDLCTYTHSGVIYAFDRDLLVAKTIYRMFAPQDMPAWPADTPLPYGLSGSETPEEAARVVEANTGVPMEVSTVFTHAELNSRAPIYTSTHAPISIHIRYERAAHMVFISTTLIRPPAPEPPRHLQ